MNKNFLLMTDVYKLGHMQQYPEGTNKVYSYLTARSDKEIPYTVFFGLQYYIKEYLMKPVTHADVAEAIEYRTKILGSCPSDIITKWNKLAKLGYIPLEIKAVDEGTVMPCKNVLMTMTNTHPDFAWLVGYTESLVLKIWNTITVASYSKKLHNLAEKFSNDTSDSGFLLPFLVHDFGYRGVSSEETAGLSGAAHLVNFLGTDTIPAVKFVNEYYTPTTDAPIGLSVPASEHSVMCAFGRENELDAFKNMLNLYPTGIVSIVSDTYNLWNVLTNFVGTLHNDIVGRDGKVVFRPDSGNPELIICGNPDAPAGTPEFKGAIRLLDERFGSTTNSKGFRELNPKVGLIYGDGMYYERYERILTRLKEMGYASTNLIIGVGGLLLQQHSRDDQGFAIKATYCEVNGVPREIVKDPITDHGKKSHKGLMMLTCKNGVYMTHDQCTPDQEKEGLLTTVFKDGKLVKEFSIEQVRERAIK
jgi:nicotinamide phosphoribosyltransferase